ncbi:MAG: undecaprenyl/decaprenyl-phosphate alpha-N-acetylglucosaminyl 1-phosphate transferase [Clostridia bacterium]|nr:undecaprenyl/decaprenyl-phosphate alpha-N-acetylglucosaminyl 1-phosphate transferase [Clostridia bacterium]
MINYNSPQQFLYVIIALICSACIAFTMTPIARVLAFKIGAVDIPKDSRRMHRVAMPLLGGVAIFTAFVVTVLAFCDLKENYRIILGLLGGASIIVATGILDDKFSLNPFLKLFLQIVAALVVALCGITIDNVGIFNSNGELFSLGSFSIPITVIWIVAVTNAVNLIDGLDGLSCGVSTISALSILVSSFFMTDVPPIAILLTAILAGSCLGFLPYNFNPAKIFMGDTGSMFLGFTLSTISVIGVFKTDAIIAYWVPFIAFAVPLFDTTFAFVRRILQGKSPFSADRGHIHHKLIDMGFNQKQSVTILYAISAIFGIASMLWAINRPIGGIVVIVCALIILFINWRFITKNDTTRQETGLGLSHLIPEKQKGTDEVAAITRSDVAEAQNNESKPDKE